MNDVDRVRILLQTLNQVLDSAHPTPAETRGHEHTPRQLAPEYHQGSYQRLEQALRAQRVEAPELYWHVAEHHLRSHRKRGHRTVWLSTKGGRKLPVTHPTVTTVRHPRVQTPQGQALVNAGEHWLAQRLAKDGPIQLPKELAA